jgi:hypothetical protein
MGAEHTGCGTGRSDLQQMLRHTWCNNPTCECTCHRVPGHEEDWDESAQLWLDRHYEDT